VPPFLLACLAYVSAALPGSTLGLLWPSMRTSFHQPLDALGIILVFGTAASVLASALAGRALQRLRMGALLASGTALVALALVIEAIAPSFWLVAFGSSLFGAGFGSVDAALNVYAANHFGPRQVNWAHASFGIGATIGPLLVTVLLNRGVGWRLVLAAFAGLLGLLGVVFVATRKNWENAPRAQARKKHLEGRPSPTSKERPARLAVWSGLTFTAMETGIESGAGIWAYVYLARGHGLSDVGAGAAVSAYWAMMVVGRATLGPLAERTGPRFVLWLAVFGVIVGAALMAAPGPVYFDVAGLMLLGLAAAPIFPLFTLTTSERLGGLGTAGTAHVVGLQVAASALGSAALPSGIGVAMGALGSRALGPFTLVLAVPMTALYWFTSVLPGRDPPPPS